MSAQPFLSEIQLFAFNFPPRGWAQCNGQLLPINQNQALFALLGTTYGGNGQTNFALPDLRGRSPMHTGNGHTLGERSGAESVTLQIAELPAHTHTIDVSQMALAARCRNAAGDQHAPAGGTPAIAGADPIYTTLQADSNMASGTVAISGTVTAANTGGSQAHDNRQPYLALQYCIALQGIFPSQA